MSVEVMSLVWKDQSLSGTELLLMLALADRADDFGVCYPSVDHLAAKTRKSRRTIQETVADLEKAGKIVIDPNAGPNGTNIYRLNVEDMAKTGGGAETARVRNPVRSSVRKVVRETAPNTSGDTIKHQESESTLSGDAVSREELKLELQDTKPTEKKPTAVFIELWCLAHQAHFQRKYIVQGAKDGDAAHRLVGCGVPIPELIGIAQAAWAHIDEFNCKFAASISGFASRINEIQVELRTLMNGKAGSPQARRAAQAAREYPEPHLESKILKL